MKAEPLDKRGPAELRAPEEEPTLAELTPASHSTSTRIRKVWWSCCLCGTFGGNGSLDSVS